MTDNQIQLRELRRKELADAETKRANEAQENLKSIEVEEKPYIEGIKSRGLVSRVFGIVGTAASRINRGASSYNRGKQLKESETRA